MLSGPNWSEYVPLSDWVGKVMWKVRLGIPTWEETRLKVAPVPLPPVTATLPVGTTEYMPGWNSDIPVMAPPAPIENTWSWPGTLNEPPWSVM